MINKTYNAELAAGSLLIPESRKVAELILRGADEADWQRFIKVDNALQKRSSASTLRQTRLLRNRLEPLPRDLLTIVANGGLDVAAQALLAAAIKHSRLLGDFMDTVVRQHLRLYEMALAKTDWNKYLEECAKRDPNVDSWAVSTRKKLGQVIIRILSESGYLTDTRTMRFQPVTLHPQIRACLEDNGERYVLRCMNLHP